MSSSLTERPALSAARLKTSRAHVRADELKFDERINRALIPSRVRKMRNALDLDGIGVVTVSERADDELVILDGQHRVRTLIENDMGEWLVDCIIHHNLTLQEEAKQYRLLNRHAASSAWDDYKIGITQGDPECLAMQAITERVGLHVANQAGQGNIACVAAMRSVFRAKSGTGPAALGFALSTAVTAWGAHSDSVDGHLVTGLGTVYMRYGEEVDRPALVRKLAKYPGVAPGLLGQAKAWRAIRGGSTGLCVARLTVDVYNRGRREQLPPL